MCAHAQRVRLKWEDKNLEFWMCRGIHCNSKAYLFMHISKCMSSLTYLLYTIKYEPHTFSVHMLYLIVMHCVVAVSHFLKDNYVWIPLSIRPRSATLLYFGKMLLTWRFSRLTFLKETERLAAELQTCLRIWKVIRESITCCWFKLLNGKS